MSQHRKLQEWTDEMASMCEPDNVVWIDGSEEEKDRLVQEAVASGEVTLLDQEKLPGCLYHRTAINDVARTEDLTYICTPRKEDAGPDEQLAGTGRRLPASKQDIQGGHEGPHDVRDPLSMGPVGSPFCKIGVELTDSIYVVLNMRIMTHMAPPSSNSSAPMANSPNASTARLIWTSSAA